MNFERPLESSDCFNENETLAARIHLSTSWFLSLAHKILHSRLILDVQIMYLSINDCKYISSRIEPLILVTEKSIVFFLW